MADMQKQSNFINYLRDSRKIRRSFLLTADALLICCAYFMAYWLRLDTFWGFSGQWDHYLNLFWKSLPLLIGLRLAANWLWHQYSWSFSHADVPDAMRLFLATVCGSLAFVLINQLGAPFGVLPPKSVYALEFSLSFIFMGALRFAPKYLYNLYCGSHLAHRNAELLRPALVYGAGGNAELLVRDLLRTTGHPYHLVGFIDDSPAKKGVYIGGLKVLGASGNLPVLIPRYDIKEILIAIPDFSGAPLRHLMDICEPFGISYKIVPRYQSMLSGQTNVLSLMEDVKPEALINRPSVPFDRQRVTNFYQGWAVLVTGAAGSIGSEICLQLASYGASRLILFDMNENGIFFLYNDLLKDHPSLKVDFEIGSVQDEKLLQIVMNKHKPDMVIHAAAHKHVPLMEACPLEAVKNNVLGTLLTAKAAAAAGAKNFLLISSDKAVIPANIMGATKRLAEIALQNIDTPMQRTIVRFGNVLGSNGSLLQIIQRQIKRGGPVTVTDPRMTRFFMTIPEAIGLVLVTPTLEPKNIFVLEMGEPVNIDKLVRHIISLAGLTPGRDIDLIYTGRRPGEKLTERLISEGQALEATEHAGIQAVRQADGRIDLDILINKVELLSKTPDLESGEDIIKEYVPEYHPAG